ncbi:hypothetical protein GSI_15389 [Ganoderma sinense ZZ0214-1]|uniref:Uncharacterized protein n=1 Tax=Ganoderma sinense ZZ0214-1 TaxID=1077348 RepID=A0A2G8RMF8_9APHY|nr:hypothetical protein GSI_15389 [Ganoderma sinense ZZ0214-1]
MKTVTTRSRPRSSTVSFYTSAQRTRAAHARLLERMPRRMSDEDARERYRREKYGQPGVVDAWLAPRLSQNPNQDHARSQSLESQNQNQSRGISTNTMLARLEAGEAAGPDFADEVRCTVRVECIKAPSDGSFFVDDDTYVLHLTTAAAGAPRCLGLGQGPDDDTRASRTAELGKYQGFPESMDAPEWVRMLPSGKPVEFRTSAAAVAKVLERTAPWKQVLAQEGGPESSEMLGVIEQEDQPRVRYTHLEENEVLAG